MCVCVRESESDRGERTEGRENTGGEHSGNVHRKRAVRGMRRRRGGVTPACSCIRRARWGRELHTRGVHPHRNKGIERGQGGREASGLHVAVLDEGEGDGRDLTHTRPTREEGGREGRRDLQVAVLDEGEGDGSCTRVVCTHRETRGMKEDKRDGWIQACM